MLLVNATRVAHEPTECPQWLERVFRLARSSLGISGKLKTQSRLEGSLGDQNRISAIQPNALNGSSDLFRLGAPSQGIFYCAYGGFSRARFEPEGCPNGLGGFSAFNPPKPGRLQA